MKRKCVLYTMIFLSILLVSQLNGIAENILDKNGMIVVGKSDDCDYKNIQMAINYASSGSTIYVKGGEYSEIIIINKDICLIGENKEKVIINPKSKTNSYAVKINAPGVEMQGFSVTNKGSGLYATGIKISVMQASIVDCDVFDVPIGIAVWSSKNSISNCNFWDCMDEGIVFLGSSISKCDENIVSNCRFFDNCDGIELQCSSNNKITNCEFYENTHAGIDVIGSSNNNNIISNCNIYDNEVFGIYLSGSSDNQIINCIIEDNKIMAADSKNTIIDNCKFKTNDLIGDSPIKIQNCINLDEKSIEYESSELRLLNKEKMIQNKILNVLITKILVIFPNIKTILHSRYN